MWGFVPQEFFATLKLLRDNNTVGKPYFADGSIGVDTFDANKDGVLKSLDGDKAYIFVTMRGGGRFMYAFDVIDPRNPHLLWKHCNSESGFSELGQTWPNPNVAVISDGRGSKKPVIVFGAG